MYNCPSKAVHKDKIKNSFITKEFLLPPANEVWGKVMFSQVFVCPQRGGGWLPSMHHKSHDQGGGANNPPAGRPGGVCPLPWDTMICSQQAGSTHPTGTHSCYNFLSNFLIGHSIHRKKKLGHVLPM